MPGQHEGVVDNDGEDGHGKKQSAGIEAVAGKSGEGAEEGLRSKGRCMLVSLQGLVVSSVHCLRAGRWGIRVAAF
jgi:hypothetical protein